jgi:6-phosphogluconolactonase/glucosamine-6-phosphate isomerase/deaminase
MTVADNLPELPPTEKEGEWWDATRHPTVGHIRKILERDLHAAAIDKLINYLEKNYQEMLKQLTKEQEEGLLTEAEERVRMELPLALDFLLEGLGAEGHFGT